MIRMNKQELDEFCKGIELEGYQIIGIKMFNNDIFFYLKKYDSNVSVDEFSARNIPQFQYN